MTRAFSRNVGVDHIDGRLVVLVEWGWFLLATVCEGDVNGKLLLLGSNDKCLLRKCYKIGIMMVFDLNLAENGAALAGHVIDVATGC